MEIVSAVQSALREQIGQDRFDLWFGGEVRLRFDEGQLVVEAANLFSLERLRGKFRDEIHAACREVLGQVPAVEFRVEASLSRSQPIKHSPVAGASVVHAAKSPPEPAGAALSARRRFANLTSFVVGDGNRIAYTAAQRVEQRLGAVTPLFFYGPTGCGKTHLLEGIWTAVRRSSRAHRIMLLSAEQFTSYFLEALQGGGLPSFRHKYRDVDLLLLDDIQFFAGKRATLVELQHTLDTLQRAGRQLVLAADRSPAELTALGPELTARMAGGLVCGVEPADAQTRLQIVRNLAMIRGVKVPQDVLELIASELSGDARQLSGALNRLQATREALDRPITLDLAERALTDIFRSTRRVVRLPDIERAICDVFGLEPQTLRSARKAKAVSQPRMLAMWLARKYTRAAFSEIGEHFGCRSHSTVISAQKKVNRWIADGTPLQLTHGACNVEEAVRRVEAQLRTA
jgi:chromosomal replication initiator protein